MVFLHIKTLHSMIKKKIKNDKFFVGESIKENGSSCPSEV